MSIGLDEMRHCCFVIGADGSHSGKKKQPHAGLISAQPLLLLPSPCVPTGSTNVVPAVPVTPAR